MQFCSLLKQSVLPHFWQETLIRRSQAGSSQRWRFFSHNGMWPTLSRRISCAASGDSATLLFFLGLNVSWASLVVSCHVPCQLCTAPLQQTTWIRVVESSYPFAFTTLAKRLRKRRSSCGKKCEGTTSWIGSWCGIANSRHSCACCKWAHFLDKEPSYVIFLCVL